MVLKGTQTRPEVKIETPLDDPTQYSPTWRAEIAVQLALYPKLKLPGPYKAYMDDAHIQEYARFLRKQENNPYADATTPIGYAFKWHKQEEFTQTKFKLEPLLLTTASFRTIADVLSGGVMGPEPVNAYERLFFNIRNDDGSLNRSCHLRMWFAMPRADDAREPGDWAQEQVWRVVGAQGGYSALCKLWVWYDAPELYDADSKYMAQETWWMVQANALNRMTKGTIGNYDLVSLIGKFTDGERLKVDSNKGESSSDQMALTALKLLELAAPRVLTVSRSVDEMDRINTRLADKRASAKVSKEELSEGNEFGKLDVKEYLAQRFTA